MVTGDAQMRRQFGTSPLHPSPFFEAVGASRQCLEALLKAVGELPQKPAGPSS